MYIAPHAQLYFLCIALFDIPFSNISLLLRKRAPFAPFGIIAAGIETDVISDQKPIFIVENRDWILVGPLGAISCTGKFKGDI